MRKWLSMAILIFAAVLLALPAGAKPPAKGTKAKFYDFSDQLIDGEIRRPTALYTDARTKAKFDRLLKLKKSFLPAMFETSKERIFK